MFFSRSELLAIRLAIGSGEGSVVFSLEGRLIDIVRVGSASKGFKLALLLGLNSKLYSGILASCTDRFDCCS